MKSRRKQLTFSLCIFVCITADFPSVRNTIRQFYRVYAYNGKEEEVKTTATVLKRKTKDFNLFSSPFGTFRPSTFAFR